ncbi:hypothetical protein DPMN_085588 [Dreissena polymorpha]|uniref:Uncharacterized protein n=1 Tax=Dreissena polymorpha TaxID=45954 RepID=A0A9D3YGS1_DREPO|nr:hypothetical protein DPMN_081183 [Dreissena polymorpha]KAH3698072.1 hypothetical protein DPMN_085588 [Dreissena polymorpha]
MGAAVTKWLGGARDRNGGRKSRETLREPALATPPPGSPSSTPANCLNFSVDRYF